MTDATSSVQAGSHCKTLPCFVARGRKRVNNFSGRESIEINIDGRINFDMPAVIQKEVQHVYSWLMIVVLVFVLIQAMNCFFLLKLYCFVPVAL